MFEYLVRGDIELWAALVKAGMLVPGYRNNLERLRSMGSVFMFYIYHAFPLFQTVATQLESDSICSGLATDNAGSLAAVNQQ